MEEVEDAGPEVASPIQLVFSVNMTAAVAPAVIFFDATGTTTDMAKADLHSELLLHGDFGDTDRQTHGPAGHPRGEDLGKMAAHGGSYVATLTVRDLAGNVSTTTRSVEIQAPVAVLCVGQATSDDCGAAAFEGCPDGASCGVIEEVGAATQEARTLGVRSLLFARGSKFSTATVLHFTSGYPA